MENLVLPINFLIFFCLHLNVDYFSEISKWVNTIAEIEYDFQIPGLIAQLWMQESLNKSLVW